MEVAQRIDDYGRPAWLGLMVVAFIVFWPAGVAILAYLLWSGRMSFWKGGASAFRTPWRSGREGGCGGREAWRKRETGASSGNSAFDEYREETLRRLEEEQEEFVEFLQRLRKAKHKAEFDQFMAERRRGAGGTDVSQGPAPQPQS